MSIVTDLIKRYEGCRLTAYRDTLGFWTAGWGHLLAQDTDWEGVQFPQAQVDAWLDRDIDHACTLASSFPHWSGLNEVRQAVLTSMCFQLGDKPLYWPHFMLALENKDYSAAAAEGLDSLWAQQTPQRAREEMSMLEHGE
jgi:lysozyme